MPSSVTLPPVTLVRPWRPTAHHDVLTTNVDETARDLEADWASFVTAHAGTDTPRIGVVASVPQVAPGLDGPIGYYVRAVMASGAQPIIIFPGRAETPLVSGLVLPGGADVDPRFYGQDVGPETRGARFAAAATSASARADRSTAR